MKVTNSDTAALSGAGQTTNTTSTLAAARARASGQSSSDHVQLSSLSGHLRGRTAEGREAHLDQLDAAVSTGQYKPNSGVISAKIIEHSMRGGVAA